MQEFTVRFDYLDKSIRVAQGTDLLTAAAKCGIALAAACGGEGLCGKCKVKIKKGKARSEVSRFIGEADRRNGYVLACGSIVEGDLEVEIPRESLELREGLKHEAEDFTKGIILKREGAFSLLPLVRKIYAELKMPTAEDSMSDLDRLTRDIMRKIDGVNLSTKLANVRHLSEVLRESDFKVTVTIGYVDGLAEILCVEPGDTSASNFGFAFDIGTTTVVGQLINLNTRDILGTRIAYNRQAAYGSDVITRIIYASEPQGLEILNEAVLDNINEIIRDLINNSGVNLGDICACVCAGNMTMMHLLLKIDPSNIRKAPYIPTSLTFPTVRLSEAGIGLNPKGVAAFLPGVSTYVGGDIVAGVLACGLSDDGDMSLLIDIGTNGEIVLGNKDWMIACAASAGPAFEGSGLTCGMKAVKGAIQKVTIGEDMAVLAETIGDAGPRGICGSGYIDLLCQMLKRGIIGKDGKINRAIKSGRIRKAEANFEFIVVPEAESATGRDIVIQEDDIENLKRAKGAIYSAIITLLNKVDKKLSDLKRIYVAGGFGNYLNINNGIFIGLMPDVERGVYEFIGNSSLAGARMSLLSHDAFRKSGDIHKAITYVDLSSETGYMDEYVASLFFPHTDLERFPSVR